MRDRIGRWPDLAMNERKAPIPAGMRIVVLLQVIEVLRGCKICQEVEVLNIVVFRLGAIVPRWSVHQLPMTCCL